MTKVVLVMGSHESDVSLITTYYKVVNRLSQDKYLKGKLQITPLKFGGNWILHSEISEFGFYPLTFEGVWILHPHVSEFGF